MSPENECPMGRLPLLFLCLILCSCASVSVRKVQRLTKNTPSRLPEKIYVHPFAFYDPALRVDRDGERLERFKHDMQERFNRELVKRLKKSVAPAEIVIVDAPLPRGNYWLIEGRFDRVYQGSRFLRAVVGFGTGGTKLDTSVLVKDLSGKKPKPFLLIETTGGSNISPGVLGTATYFVSGITALGNIANIVEGVRTGISFDMVRTTREVTATMATYLKEEGALPENTPAPKHLGRINYWPFNQAPQTKKGTVTVTPAQ